MYFSIEKILEEQVKKISVLALIVLAVSFAACKKKGVSDEVLETRYLQYRANAYKEKELNKKDNWLATLEKGEAVGLLEEFDGIDNNGKPAKIAKIKLSDDSVGYTKSAWLVKKVYAIFQKDVKVYNRNNEGSGLMGKAAMGSIAAMTEEKGGWIKAYVILENGKTREGWLKDGFSDSTDHVTDAVAFEKGSALYASSDAKSKEEGETILKELASKASFLSSAASDKLGLAGKAADSSDEGWQETTETTESAE